MALLGFFASVFSFNVMCSIVYCGPRYDLPSDPLIDTGNNIIEQNNDFSRDYNSRVAYGRALNREEEIDRNPIVFTNYGGVAGYIMETISKRKIYAFEGIPYGENTGGPNRFQPPIPKAPWRGIREAKNTGSICPQTTVVLTGWIKGSEDCLFLNVYAIPNAKINKPKSESKGNLPVLVWIHGGAFVIGASSEYGVSYLLDSHDMIVVTINYRLGILGFLTTGDDVSPGNNGLKDQALALKWIYENIGHFGGNNSQITIMGQSAGAASVHLHMLSKQSRNYFSGAVSLSGSAFNIWAIRKPSTTDVMNERIARFTNCPLKPSRAFVDCLKGYSALDLAKNQNYLPDWLSFPACVLAPVVEPESEHAFLTKSAAEYYESNDVAKVPFIVTRTKDETLFGFIVLKVLLLTGHVARHLKEKLPVVLEYNRMNFNSMELDDLSEKILTYYTQDLKYTNLTELLTEGSSDRFFTYATNKAIKAHSKIAPTYSYIFNVRGEHNFPSFFGMDPQQWGVSHIDDMLYLVNTTFTNAWKTTEYGYPLVKFMVDLFSNFVALGEPLHRDAHGKYWKIWEAVTDPEDVKYLSIEESAIKMIPEPNNERFKFWESLNLPDMQPLNPNYLKP